MTKEDVQQTRIKLNDLYCQVQQITSDLMYLADQYYEGGRVADSLRGCALDLDSVADILAHDETIPENSISVEIDGDDVEFCPDDSVGYIDYRGKVHGAYISQNQSGHEDKICVDVKADAPRKRTLEIDTNCLIYHWNLRNLENFGWNLMVQRLEKQNKSVSLRRNHSSAYRYDFAVADNDTGKIILQSENMELNDLITTMGKLTKYHEKENGNPT